MIEISCKEDFEKSLNSEKAIIFIFFDWSGQSHFSESNLLKWRKITEFTQIPVYKLNPEICEFSQNWVYSVVKDKTGYGSMVWLINGSIKYVEKNVGNLKVEEFEQITEHVFS